MLLIWTKKPSALSPSGTSLPGRDDSGSLACLLSLLPLDCAPELQALEGLDLGAAGHGAASEDKMRLVIYADEVDELFSRPLDSLCKG